MRSVRESELFDAVSLLDPSYYARRFAHGNGIPWEKVRSLETLLGVMSSPAIEFFDGDDYSALAGARRSIYRAFELCGSPIEELFLAYMAPSYPDWKWVEEGVAESGDTRIHLQHQVETFRLDFSITTPSTRVAVELDGHEWHERNKQQATKDKSRDRRLQELGWKVLRFTGSEVWADPQKCVDDTCRIAGVYG